MKKIEEVYRKAYTFIDVRSPKEFAEDHIPGAISLPLLSDDERAIVGTIYKQEDKEKALSIALQIVSQKLPMMVRAYQEQKGPLCIYCWRGGMRSGSIVTLLQSLHYDVVQLENGYKDYRRFVREQLETFSIPHVVVLYGLTGSGKTEMLHQLPRSIDLEGLAQHRGSIFGDIGLQTQRQKFFESLLLKRLYELQHEKIIFIEGESRKIGDIIIPFGLWQAMQKGTKVRVVCSHEERVERIYKEYCLQVDTTLIEKKVFALKNYLGKKKTEELLLLLKQGRIQEFISFLLLEYYDPLYQHTVNRKTYRADVSHVQELHKLFP